MIDTVLQSIAAFAGTNVDDILILTILLASAGPRYKGRVMAGQYIGVLSLLAISIAASRAASFILSGYSWVLGIVPIILGVRYALKQDGLDEEDVPLGIMPTALLAISNGADNLGVYIPLLSGYDVWDIITMTVVFIIMLALWCMIAHAVSGRDAIGRLIRRYERVAVPAVLMILGIVIIADGSS